MSLVCVPLDVEDTLSCYHQALEKKTYCLQMFQHSRSLLVLLLANTQPCKFFTVWITHTHVAQYFKLILFALLVSLVRFYDTDAALSEPRSQPFSELCEFQSRCYAHSKHPTMWPDRGGLQYSRCYLWLPYQPWPLADYHFCILHFYKYENKKCLETVETFIAHFT